MQAPCSASGKAWVSGKAAGAMGAQSHTQRWPRGDNTQAQLVTRQQRNLVKKQNCSTWRRCTAVQNPRCVTAGAPTVRMAPPGLRRCLANNRGASGWRTLLGKRQVVQTVKCPSHDRGGGGRAVERARLCRSQERQEAQVTAVFFLGDVSAAWRYMHKRALGPPATVRLWAQCTLPGGRRAGPLVGQGSVPKAQRVIRVASHSTSDLSDTSGLVSRVAVTRPQNEMAARDSDSLTFVLSPEANEKAQWPARPSEAWPGRLWLGQLPAWSSLRAGQKEATPGQRCPGNSY